MVKESHYLVWKLNEPQSSALKNIYLSCFYRAFTKIYWVLCEHYLLIVGGRFHKSKPEFMRNFQSQCRFSATSG